MSLSSDSPASAAAADPPTPRIRDVLGRPGVLAPFALSLAAQFPFASVGVLYLVRIAPHHGYAAAGVVDALYAVAIAIAGAVWARRMQHVAIGRVVLPLALLNGAAIIAAGFLPTTAPLAAFAALAIANGLTQPSYGGAMRALWDQLVERDDERHVGYALEGTLGEAVYLVSPAVMIGVFASLAGPQFALFVAGVISAVAGTAYALSPRVWGAKTTAHEARSKGALGTLRYPGVRTCVALCAALGAYIGPIEIAVSAYGRAQHSTGTIGVLFALWSTGGMLAGFALTRRPPATHPVRRMTILSAWMLAWSAAFALGGGTVGFTVALVLSGAVLTPIFITMNATFDRIAPAGTEAEIYNLTMAGLLAGTMTTVPVTGAVIDAHGPLAGALVSVGGGVMAIALLAWRRHDFDARDAPFEAATT